MVGPSLLKVFPRIPTSETDERYKNCPFLPLYPHLFISRQKWIFGEQISSVLFLHFLLAGKFQAEWLGGEAVALCQRHTFQGSFSFIPFASHSDDLKACPLHSVSRMYFSIDIISANRRAYASNASGWIFDFIVFQRFKSKSVFVFSLWTSHFWGLIILFLYYYIQKKKKKIINVYWMLKKLYHQIERILKF